MAQSHLNVGVLSDCEKPYVIESILGGGSCGTVAKAYDRRTKRPVAIKRVELTDDPMHTLALARELRFLHALRCDNIVSLLDMKDIREGVLHRDIKPANILLDYNMKVKLCDFGMARMVGNNGDCQAFAEPCIGNLSENVVTIYYRAPEVMLCQGRYGKAQDVWSIACTFAEVIRKAPLFYGTTDAQQLRLIIDMMGNPSDNHLDFDMSDRARAYVKNITSQETGLEAALPGVHDIHPETLQEDMNLIEEWGMDVSDNTLKLLECECSRIKKDLISSPIGSYPSLGLNRNLIPSPQHMAPLGNKPPPHDS
eukprot:gene39082-51429_t